MRLEDALQTFVAESRQLLTDMEDALMRLETSPQDAEAVPAVFRAAHTIKGAAGLFGFDHVVAFTHEVETLLARLRDGELALDERLPGLLLQCGDHIGGLVDLAAGATEPDPATCARGAELMRHLCACAGRPAAAAGAPDADAPGQARARAGADAAADIWHLSVRFGPGILREGFDPSACLHHLAGMGRIEQVSTALSALPPLAEMDPEACYLGFEVRLRTACSKSEIESVFDYVRDDCQLHLLPPSSRLEDYLQLLRALPADQLRLGEMLVAAGALTEKELAAALERQCAERDPVRPLGQILVEQRAVQPELVEAAVGRQAEARQRMAQESRMLRVQAGKLDALIDLVGELVIASAGVGSLARGTDNRPLREAVATLSSLTEGVREEAMRLRMVEIGETFNRFRRVVRDVAKELGKDIELVIRGADTELDKSVVDRIGDPLLHLVRNAIDHGIEPAAVRRARGKPATGRITLQAAHEAGSVLIDVSDDGGGLDRERIAAKAVERGLLAPGAQPSDAEVYQMIFEPGFSTAESVSNLSGRGVGMDVVQRDIQALRGAVEIDSQRGQGTRLRIRLPLTLAIIDGFLLRVADGHYVVPLDKVLECIHLDPARAASGRDYLDLRGETLPLIPLRRHFGLDGAAPRRQNIVVVRHGAGKLGLVVDQLCGELQAVVKPLGPLMDGLPGIAGTSILGTGDVALMLDVPRLAIDAARRDLSRARPH